ncbi:MAG: hypothetical protein J6X02_02720 [Bacilli bacterium]|nr:hypothetical protein [Bacilli bacterium]
MSKKSIVKNLTLYLSMIFRLVVLSSSNNNKRGKNFFRNTTKVYKNKIEYNSGTIYIGDEEYLSTIGELGVNDVLVLDKRDNEDPDLKIIDAYRIVNNEIKEEIVEGLLLYEEVYPTKWFRTTKTSVREWVSHDLMYRFGYKRHRTTYLDLNNADEKTYTIRKK